MADNVTAPITSPTVIATDQVTRDAVAVHAQLVKILDGTDGSVNPLKVDHVGAIRSGKRFYRAQGSGSVVNASHGDGELLCDVIDLGVHPDGVLTSFTLTVSTDTALALDPISVMLAPRVTGGPVLGSDGDLNPATWNDWRNSIVVDSSEFGAPKGLTPGGDPARALTAVSQPGWFAPLLVNGIGDLGVPNHQHQLYALVVADGASSSDYTGSISVSFTAEWHYGDIV